MHTSPTPMALLSKGTQAKGTHLKSTKNLFVILIFRIFSVITENYLCFKYILLYIRIVVNTFINHNFYMPFALLNHRKSKMEKLSSD